MPSSPDPLDDPLDDLASDPGLLEELLDARAAGVSWRRYSGWEPERVTTFEYDGDRLVRAVTTTEPEWNDQERAAVRALRRYEAGLCPGCRHPLAETTDPATQYGYVRKGPPLRCHYCQMLEIYQHADSEEQQPASLLYQLHRKPPEREGDDDG